MIIHHIVFSCWQKLSNDNCVNQGIAKKLYTLVQNISLFFSAYIVTLAVQWKLTLIIMSIVSVIVLMIAECLNFNASLKVWIISSKADIVKQECVSDTAFV